MRYSYNCILAGINTEQVRVDLEKLGYTRVGDVVGNYIITSTEGTYSCYTEREFAIMRYGGRLEDHVMSIKNVGFFLDVARMREDNEDQEYVQKRDTLMYENIYVPFGQLNTKLSSGDHKITLYEVKEKHGIEHSYKFDKLSVAYGNKVESIGMFHVMRSIFKDLSIDSNAFRDGEDSGYIVLNREIGKLSVCGSEYGHVCENFREFLVLALATKEWDLNQYVRVGEDIVFSTDFCCTGKEELDNESIVEKIREEN